MSCTHVTSRTTWGDHEWSDVHEGGVWLDRTPRECAIDRAKRLRMDPTSTRIEVTHRPDRSVIRIVRPTHAEVLTYREIDRSDAMDLLVDDRNQS